eukprot:scaffold9266_cov151-Skeletonema_dohrnii-CCMP3373.AAC.1
MQSALVQPRPTPPSPAQRGYYDHFMTACFLRNFPTTSSSSTSRQSSHSWNKTETGSRQGNCSVHKNRTAHRQFFSPFQNV